MNSNYHNIKNKYSMYLRKESLKIVRLNKDTYEKHPALKIILFNGFNIFYSDNIWTN